MTFSTLIRTSTVALAATSLMLVGCSDEGTTPEPSKAGTFKGTPTTVGNGTVTGWVVLNDAGNPTQVGLTVTESALTGLDESAPMEYVVNLPAQASTTLFDHVSFDYLPSGHEPSGIYDRGHFDVHFYMVSSSRRDDIAPGTQDPEPSDYIAADYQGVPYMAIPRMGVHYVDTKSHEFMGETFDRTLIYGYDKGVMTFIEPMITLEYLRTKPTASMPIRVPNMVKRSGYYPTKYSVAYNETSKEYTIVLQDMVKR